jgi:hypothetical protein
VSGAFVAKLAECAVVPLANRYALGGGDVVSISLPDSDATMVGIDGIRVWSLGDLRIASCLNRMSTVTSVPN